MLEVLVEDSIEVELRHVGVPGRSIVEGHPLAQMERVLELVLGDIPTRGESGNDRRTIDVLDGQVLLNEAFVNVEGLAISEPQHMCVGIETAGLAFDSKNDGFSLRLRRTIRRYQRTRSKH